MIAFLGVGHLGANFTKALINKGKQVNVWNRTGDKAKALEAVGAKAFDSVADAVRDADMVHLTLKDDAAVDEVLANAKPGLKPGAFIIDHTTTSVKGAVERTKNWKEEGFIYIHAPVFMGPQNALESTGLMLVSGDEETLNRVKEDLSAMTGKLINLGAEAGKAAGMKLSGNLFLMSVTAGLADMLSLAKATGISADEVASLVNTWNPGTSVPMRLGKMMSGKFNEPSWELNMARKDAGLMLEEVKAAGLDLIATPAIAAAMDSWIEKGYGHEDWTVIGKNSL